MSWSGNVTLYSQNGKLLKSFHAADTIIIYADVPSAVCFVNGRKEVIMQTNLPFIMDCERDEETERISREVPTSDSMVKLMAMGGNIVREFRFHTWYQNRGIQIYIQKDGSQVITSFPMIIEPVKG